MLEVDHVVMGVAHPDAAASLLRKRFGLGAVEGGLHPNGTGNWLVPLRPPQYLELLYVADRQAAAAGPSAQLLQRDLSAYPLLAWAVRTDHIDAVGRRLKIEPVAGSVEGPDGSGSRWRVVADFSPEITSRPFFIEYDDPSGVRPAEWQRRYAAARHEVSVGGFSWIELGGDEADTRAWLGETTVPIQFVGGIAGPNAVAIAGPTGDIVVRPRDLRS